MRKFSLFAAMAVAAAFLAGCIFESTKPLVPEADYATPLAAGNYQLLERKEDGQFVKESDSTLTLIDKSYTLTTPDGPMKFVLYRVAPKTFLLQFSDKPDSYVYLILGVDPDGASLTHLECAQLNQEERARFGLPAGDKDSCVFDDLDQLVTASLYLKGRGAQSALRLVKQ
jgi:hypothetical protein